MIDGKEIVDMMIKDRMIKIGVIAIVLNLAVPCVLSMLDWPPPPKAACSCQELK